MKMTANDNNPLIPGTVDFLDRHPPVVKVAVNRPKVTILDSFGTDEDASVGRTVGVMPVNVWAEQVRV